jgi:dynein heavy chain
MLFEVGHLSYSAPSTVSRMGIVYVDPDKLGFKPFWLRWLEPRCLMEQTALDQCFQKYVPVLLSLIFGNGNGSRKSCPLKTTVPQTKLNMVRVYEMSSDYIVTEARVNVIFSLDNVTLNLHFLLF